MIRMSLLKNTVIYFAAVAVKNKPAPVGSERSKLMAAKPGETMSRNNPLKDKSSSRRNIRRTLLDSLAAYRRRNLSFEHLEYRRLLAITVSPEAFGRDNVRSTIVKDVALTTGEHISLNVNHRPVSLREVPPGRINGTAYTLVDAQRGEGAGQYSHVQHADPPGYRAEFSKLIINYKRQSASVC